MRSLLFGILFFLTSCSTFFEQMKADSYHIRLETYREYKDEYYNEIKDFYEFSTFEEFVWLRKKKNLEQVKKLYDEYYNEIKDFYEFSTFEEFVLLRKERDLEQVKKLYEEYSNNYSYLSNFVDFLSVKYEFSYNNDRNYYSSPLYYKIYYYINFSTPKKERSSKFIKNFYDSWEKCPQFPEDIKIKKNRLCGHLDFKNYLNFYIKLSKVNCYNLNEIISKYGSDIVLNAYISWRKKPFGSDWNDEMRTIIDQYDKHISKIINEKKQQIEEARERKRIQKEEYEMKKAYGGTKFYYY